MEQSAVTTDTDVQALHSLPTEIHGLAKALSDRYVIEREIGRGGMATVYLARDLRHDRKVALKVLDAELGAILGVERFLSEIKVTANLQHPNLLPLFDSGGADGRLFYVMPFVEGESLRARIERDKQLPVDEALEITAAVASALDYAHQHGVIHRDLKPENILMQGRHAVVADFGIALAVSNAGGARVTQTGISLGTPQYMSPEQATGDRAIDGRSDIYSLAAVTYEMLSGEPPHTGTTAQSIVAKLLTEEVRPIRALRRSVPLHVDDAVRHGLEKLPADRFARAEEFARALGTPSSSSGYRTSEVKYGSRSLAKPLLIACGAFIVGAALAGFAVRSRGSSTVAQERYLNVVMPDSLPVSLSGNDVPLGIWQRAMAVSSDGRLLAYVARKSSGNKLVVRHLDNGETTELPGSDGAYSPFFSPDDKWIAFFDGNNLKKISVGGGEPVTIATDLLVPLGGVWPSQDQIAVTRDEGHELVWYSSSGGKAERTDSLGNDWTAFPQMLPGGKAAVAHGLRGLKLIRFDPVKVFDITMKGVVPAGSDTDPIRGHDPVYSSSGHLVYASIDDGRLMAVPFDAKSFKVLGAPALVLENVRKEQTYDAGQYAIAGDGTFVYASGGSGDFGRLAFVSESGQVDTLPYPRAIYRNLTLAPDGQRVYTRLVDETGGWKNVALDVHTNHEEDLNPQTFGSSAVVFRVLDDGSVLKGDARTGATSIVSAQTSAEQVVDSGKTFIGSSGWDVDRARTFVVRSLPSGKIAVHQLAGDTTTRYLPNEGSWARLSADGHWIAYTTNALSIDVSPVPPTGASYQISSESAEQPLWSQSGNAVYFRQGRRIWKADVSTSNGFHVNSVHQIIDAPLIRIRGSSYDIARDGRLLVVLGSPEVSAPSLNVITGFGSRLNRLAPSK